MTTTIEARLTAAVRAADEMFEKVGGSTRHWVRDCFLPHLADAGLSVNDTKDAPALRASPSGEKEGGAADETA